MKTIPFILFLLVTLALRSPGATINETINSLNEGVKKDGNPTKVLQAISASTKVPVATLEKRKSKTNLSYGDLFIAHAIASAAGKTFDQIAALKLQGQTWDQVAEANNVSLGGNKKKEVANPRKQMPLPPSAQISDGRSQNPNDISSQFMGRR